MINKLPKLIKKSRKIKIIQKIGNVLTAIMLTLQGDNFATYVKIKENLQSLNEFQFFIQFKIEKIILVNIFIRN